MAYTTDQAIFDHGDHRDLIRDLMQAETPRLLTTATSDGDLLHLPWELMADERGALTRHDITIRRQLETVKQNLTYHVGSLQPLGHYLRRLATGLAGEALSALV